MIQECITELLATNKSKKEIVRIKPLIYRRLYSDITINYLDTHFRHYLISGEDSWSEIPRQYWFCLKNELSGSAAESWWDIRQLLLHITQCLNSSNMGNSYPQFPTDPFTRIPITYESLSEIYRRATELQLPMHSSCIVFLYYLEGKNHKKQNERWKKGLMDTKQINMILSSWLRYRNINSQDSQGNFVGIWEPKFKELDEFERKYREYCQYPPFVFEFGLEIMNPRRSMLEKILHQLPREDWNSMKNSYPADTNPCCFNPKRSAMDL